MHTQRILFGSLCLALAVAVCFRPLHAQEQAAGVDEQELIQILESDAPKAEKAITCKKLAVYGSGEAVPALAKLLPDPELTSWARIALEAIPDPAADATLREALSQVEGRTLIGVINSIGFRGDEQAVEALAARLDDADAEVASAAAVALGKIGNAEATETLREALADVPEGVRSAVAEGCVLCAEKLMEAGALQQAAAIYDQVRSADVPKQRIVEATRGAILARAAEGVPLLVEQLTSGDEDLAGIALMTARELAGEGVTESLVAALDDLPPDQQSLLITALAERDDPDALPVMIEVAQSTSGAVQLAAVGYLQRLGDASCVPVLLEIACGSDEAAAPAALDALQSLPGDDVDAVLTQRLDDAEGSELRVLVELVGRRRIPAVDALKTTLEEGDTEIRNAALGALGQAVELDELPVLIQWAIHPPQADNALAAQQALRAAAVRMPDREACATMLAEAMDEAPTSAQITILETLAAMGGPTALQAMAEAANSDNPQLQDNATRLLGSWMTVDAGPVLLDLAQSPGPYQVRALRGYIRLARQFVMPDQQRVEMCRKALEAAERDAERKLVLEVVQRYPSVDMLRLAVEAGKLPGLKDDAAAAAMAVAQEIGGTDNVRQLLEQLGQEPVEIEIIEAQYGAGEQQKDVTSVLRQHVRDFPLVVLPSSSYNSAFGGDPAPGVVKQLRIRYRIDGKTGEAVFEENATIMLPMPK